MRGFEAFPRWSATSLSGAPPAQRSWRGLFLVLARLSLGGSCLSLLSSCLVDDPPPYSEAKQTPPRLNYHDAVPLLDQVIVAKSLDTITFTVPVASEDAGEGLNAFLLIDYKGEATAKIAQTKSIPPSTLAEPRDIELKWQAGGTPGCHRLTLRVGHVSNLPEAGSHPTTNASDIAEAYWWINIDTDPALGNSLADCPLASRSQP